MNVVKQPDDNRTNSLIIHRFYEVLIFKNIKKNNNKKQKNNNKKEKTQKTRIKQETKTSNQNISETTITTITTKTTATKRNLRGIQFKLTYIGGFHIDKHAYREIPKI
jgi:hypothetical protein